MQDISTADRRGRITRGLLCGTALLALAACNDGMDMDLRGNLGGFSTAEAAQGATADRPRPDNRGIISYPSYQVVVARRGDTVADVATRIGVRPQDLAAYNGLRPEDPLRADEVLALPGRVAEPSPATGAVGTGPILPAGQVDIGALAGGAIDRAGDQRVEVSELPPAQQPQTGAEPVRHKVQRGETAYTVSRLYNVSVRSLADWNGLDSDFTIREGQFLLIPVAEAAPPVIESATATTVPGQGSPTPVPPSASQPLPAEKTQPVAAATGATTAAAQPAAAQPTAAPDLGKQQTPAKAAAMAYPVKGNIIRDFARGTSDGINIAAAPGTAITAADAGTVAAITADADNKKVIVVRHQGKLLTIYSNVDNIAVSEGATVSRGQKLAEIRAGASPYLHFEVRKGLEAVDPMDFLN